MRNISSPSNTSNVINEDVLDSTYLSVSIHPALLHAQINIFSNDDVPDWCVIAGKQISENSLFSKCSDIGIGSFDRNEASVTAHITSILQFYSPKEISTEGHPLILWLHQHQGIYICGVRWQSIQQKQGYEPRVFFKFGMPDHSTNKSLQLLGYVNNSECDLDTDHWLISLGVEVYFSEQSGTYTLKGYYKTVDENRKAKIAIVTLGSGYWDENGIPKLLNTLYSFLMRDPDEFIVPNQIIMHTRHYIDNSNGFVYKVYDSREHFTTRNPEPNLIFIENCEKIIDKKKLIIIRYPFIPGSHIPPNSTQIQTLIQTLKNIHNQQYIHGDIRASNIVFADSDSKIIDFDLSCHIESISKYPSTYNIDIQDGKRHSDALPKSIMRIEHDWFSLSVVLSYFQPDENMFNFLWEEVIKNVLNGNLDVAINLLVNNEFFTLKLSKEINTSITGTPKKEKVK